MAGLLGMLTLAVTLEATADEARAVAHRPGRGVPAPVRPGYFREGWEVQIDHFWARQSEAQERRPGFGIAVGSATHRVPTPGFLFGSQQLALRVLDSQSYSLSLSRHLVRGGLVTGPFEASAGFGFSTITVDVIHGAWSAGLLSPLATAGFGLRFGATRLCVSAYSEYLWRWTQDDFWVRGLSLSLGIDLERPAAQRVP